MRDLLKVCLINCAKPYQSQQMALCWSDLRRRGALIPTLWMFALNVKKEARKRRGDVLSGWPFVGNRASITGAWTEYGARFTVFRILTQLTKKAVGLWVSMDRMANIIFEGTTDCEKLVVFSYQQYI